MRKIIAMLTAMAIALGAAGCVPASEEIAVISREEGSGTRGAFIELFGILQTDANGNKVDYTTEDADTTQSTSVVLTSVAGNQNAIGYISVASLNDTVKALKIDGAEPTEANIKSGGYKIARPFNIVTKPGVSEAAQAFIDFILSARGQEVIANNGCVAIGEGEPFAGSDVSGKVVVAGSSSVTPVMEKLKEAYIAMNPNAVIEIQQSDSSAGVNMTIEGTCDIGMVSRELKQSELDAGITPTVIAIDGIVVIVNKGRNLDGLTSEQVRAIFMGEITKWEELDA